MTKTVIRNQSGVVFLLISVLIALAMIVAIATAAKKTHDRQQGIKQTQSN